MDLPKGGTKAQAIQAALKKSREAKLIKKKVRQPNSMSVLG
jgi:hypothetical protein